MSFFNIVLYHFPTFCFTAFCTKNNTSNWFYFLGLAEGNEMIALVSLHQAVLLIFNDLAQSHLAVGWKAPEMTDFCKLQEKRCLGKEGQVCLKFPLRGRTRIQLSSLCPAHAEWIRRRGYGRALTVCVLGLAEAYLHCACTERRNMRQLFMENQTLLIPLSIKNCPFF